MELTTKEKIAVMQAYEDGKLCQFRPKRHDKVEWADISKITTVAWNWQNFEYRLKPADPKKKYRPYESSAEMIADFKERFLKVRVPSYANQLIWVEDKRRDSISLISGYISKDIVYVMDSMVLVEDLFEFYNYLDGSPIGKLVGE